MNNCKKKITGDILEETFFCPISEFLEICSELFTVVSIVNHYRFSRKLVHKRKSVELSMNFCMDLGNDLGIYDLGHFAPLNR